MRKLLTADFSRLFRSKIYWLGMLFMFGFAAFAVVARYTDVQRYPGWAYKTADGLWFIGGVYIAVVLAVFISVWVGTDYSDGTIRNKLAVGHTRNEIYLSKWIVCNTASLLMHVIYIVVIATLGSLLLDSFETPIKVLVILSLASLLSVVALTSILLVFANLIHSKAANAIVSILLAFVMLMAVFTLYSSLTAPEYTTLNVEMSVDGELVQGDPIPNPIYPTGVKRVIYQAILNILPAGQMIQFGDLTYPNDLAFFPLYSLAVTLVFTAIGLVLFKKKDLK